MPAIGCSRSGGRGKYGDKADTSKGQLLLREVLEEPETDKRLPVLVPKSTMQGVYPDSHSVRFPYVAQNVLSLWAEMGIFNAKTTWIFEKEKVFLYIIKQVFFALLSCI